MLPKTERLINDAHATQRHLAQITYAFVLADEARDSSNTRTTRRTWNKSMCAYRQANRLKENAFRRLTAHFSRRDTI